MISAQIDRVRRVVVGRESYYSVYQPLVEESVSPLFRARLEEMHAMINDRYRDDLMFLAATYFEQERQAQLQRERRGDV